MLIRYHGVNGVINNLFLTQLACKFSLPVNPLSEAIFKVRIKVDMKPIPSNFYNGYVGATPRKPPVWPMRICIFEVPLILNVWEKSPPGVGGKPCVRSMKMN